MSNPWDKDPIVTKTGAAKAAPWANDPIVRKGYVNKVKGAFTDAAKKLSDDATAKDSSKRDALGDVVNLVTAPLTEAALPPFRSAANALESRGIRAGTMTLNGPRYMDTEGHAKTLLDTAVTATGLGMPARALPARAAAAAAPKVNVMAQNAERLRSAGVTPYVALADAGRGKVAATNVIAENPIAGIAVRSRLRNTIDEVGAAASARAAEFGSARGRQATGEAIQSGVDRFANARVKPPESVSAPARNTSFTAKAKTVYDRAFEPILKAEQNAVTQNLNRAQRAKNMGGAPAIGGVKEAIVPAKTMETLGAINNRVNAPELSKVLSEGPFQRVSQALQTDGANVRFTDLRGLRTWVREAQGNPTLRDSIGSANLQRLEGALTEDIYANAASLAGPKAAAHLKRADDFYRAGSNRINNSLNTYFKALSGETAYSKVVSAAGSSSTADAKTLVALKRSLKPEDWGDVSANVLSELGKPLPGAAEVGNDAGFSVSTFVSNYNKLSPRGKDILFGSTGGGGGKATGLRKALEDLAWAADQAKKIEKGANASKSAVAGQSIATIAGLANPGTTIPTATGLSGFYLTGEALTNPRVLKILTKSIKQKMTPQQTVKALSNVIDITPYLRPATSAAAVANQAGSSTSQVIPSVAAEEDR